MRKILRARWVDVLAAAVWLGSRDSVPSTAILKRYNRKTIPLWHGQPPTTHIHPRTCTYNSPASPCGKGAMNGSYNMGARKIAFPGRWATVPYGQAPLLLHVLVQPHAPTRHTHTHVHVQRTSVRVGHGLPRVSCLTTNTHTRTRPPRCFTYQPARSRGAAALRRAAGRGHGATPLPPRARSVE